MSRAFATLDRRAPLPPAPRITAMSEPIKQRVYLTGHAIEQSRRKFPLLQKVSETIGHDEFVRRLTACAGHAVDSGRATVILGDKFLIGEFWDGASRTMTPIVFAAVPDDIKAGHWSIRTCLTLEQVAANGNCQR